jgi:hypothetical protein
MVAPNDEAAWSFDTRKLPERQQERGRAVTSSNYRRLSDVFGFTTLAEAGPLSTLYPTEFVRVLGEKMARLCCPRYWDCKEIT